MLDQQLPLVLHGPPLPPDLKPPKAHSLRRKYPPVCHEFRVISLREIPAYDSLVMCDTPERAAAYWRHYVSTSPAFNPDIENMVILLLNTRRRVKGHYLASQGTVDTILIHPSQVFRAAIVANASAVILAHNHPSGDPTPSEADIKVTRDMIRAGQLLKIDVLDSVVMGTRSLDHDKDFTSLRELGYFYS